MYSLIVVSTKETIYSLRLIFVTPDFGLRNSSPPSNQELGLGITIFRPYALRPMYSTVQILPKSVRTRSPIFMCVIGLGRFLNIYLLWEECIRYNHPFLLGSKS